jgi:coiled-coil and C2 domain-containing protein 1
MKLHRAGKPIPIDDLPTPPGFGPIPVNKPSALSPPKSSGQMSSHSSASSIAPVSPQPSSVSVSPSQQPSSKSQSAEKPLKKPLTLQEKQLLLLEKRQELFKQAAVEAKKSGQLEQVFFNIKKCYGGLLNLCFH